MGNNRKKEAMSQLIKLYKNEAKRLGAITKWEAIEKSSMNMIISHFETTNNFFQRLYLYRQIV